MSAETREALGARIRSLRKENNLSQEKLALMVGVERSYLARLEGGKRNPSIDVVEKIAGGLNVTLAELFEGIGPDLQRPHPNPGALATGTRPGSVRCFLTKLPPE